MTHADYAAAIKTAMEKVPKCVWTRCSGHVQIPETDDNSAGDINLNAVFNRLVGKYFARYIAACHPAALRSLLDEREALMADAERYRWLREQNDDDFVFSVVKNPHFDVYESPDELDAAIDAALKDTK